MIYCYLLNHVFSNLIRMAKVAARRCFVQQRVTKNRWWSCCYVRELIRTSLVMQVPPVLWLLRGEIYTACWNYWDLLLLIMSWGTRLKCRSCLLRWVFHKSFFWGDLLVLFSLLFSFICFLFYLYVNRKSCINFSCNSYICNSLIWNEI